MTEECKPGDYKATVTMLPTETVRGQEADRASLKNLVDGLVKRHAAGGIRAATVIIVTPDGEWFSSHANTTLSDEAYGLQLLQARLTRCLLDDPM